MAAKIAEQQTEQLYIICAQHDVENKKQKSNQTEQYGKPLGSKYLVKAPSGLRIVILSEGSD
jgi:hypothetical protein